MMVPEPTRRGFFTQRDIRFLVKASPTWDDFLQNTANFIIEKRLPKETDTDDLTGFLNALIETNCEKHYNTLKAI